MKTTVSLYDFRDAFRRVRPDNFSYEGLEVLFDYLEACESGADEIELDVIALCCDFSEASVDEIAENYSIDLSECDDDEEKAEAVRDYIERHSIVVGEVAGGFVYADF